MREVRQVREGERELERKRKGKEELPSSPLLIHADLSGTYSLLRSLIHADPSRKSALPQAFV